MWNDEWLEMDYEDRTAIDDYGDGDFYEDDDQDDEEDPF